MDVYVRKGRRFNPATRSYMQDCLDIASISVHATGQGVFTAWLKQMIETAREKGFNGLYVENVLTERFAEFFRKRGWRGHNEGLPSFFLDLAPQPKLEDSPSP